MAAAAGLFSRAMTAGQALTPLDTSTSGTSSSGSSSSTSSSASATISANDFLELLVTEMQNQDPTDETDPNEYIDQLVDVNSLEQLIDINQTLSGAFPAASSSAAGDAASAQAASASASPSSALAPAALQGASPSARPAAPTSTSVPGAYSAYPSPAAPSSPRRVSGNLSVPAALPAAQRVAHALDGRPRARPLGGKLAGIAQSTLNNRP
jgi:flagellar basal-body rod modification protein FlgD